jgi:hypothetical protein
MKSGRHIRRHVKTNVIEKLQCRAMRMYSATSCLLYGKDSPAVSQRVCAQQLPPSLGITLQPLVISCIETDICMLTPVTGCLPAFRRFEGDHQLHILINHACLQSTNNIFQGLLRGSQQTFATKPNRIALIPILSRNEVKPVHQPAMRSKTRAIWFETLADLQPFHHHNLYCPCLSALMPDVSRHGETVCIHTCTYSQRVLNIILMLVA